MKLKIRLFYKLFLTILLFVSGLMIASGLFPAINMLCSPNDARTRRDLIKKKWLSLFSAIVNLSVVKEGCASEHTTLLASNHISWLDIIVIGQYLPAYFVAKSDILNWPVIGFLSRQAGTVFIRRGDKKNILATGEKMIWLLNQKGNIIIFPEGTTTMGDEVRNFHASLFQPALLTKSAIQPVAVQYLGEAKELAPFVGDNAFVTHLIKLLMMDKIEVQLCFLPVINTTGKNRQSVSHETRRMILTAISSGSVSVPSDNNLLKLAQDTARHQPRKSSRIFNRKRA